MLDPRQLDAFLAVVRTGSTVAAAGVMNVSQPSVSRLVAALEREVGLTLFERRQGRLLLAPQGRAFHDEVEQLYLGTAELRVRARDIAAAAENELRVATIAAGALDLVPRALGSVHAAQREARVAVLMRSHFRVIEMVGSGRAVVGIVNAVSAADPVQAIGEWQLPCVVVVSPDHRLADHDFITVDNIPVGELISLGDAFHARASADPAVAKALGRLTGVTANLSLPACRLVATGLGVAIVDPLTAAAEAAGGHVVPRPFRPTLRYPVSIIVRRSENADDLSPTVSLFVRKLRTMLDALAAGAPGEQ